MRSKAERPESLTLVGSDGRLPEPAASVTPRIKTMAEIETTRSRLRVATGNKPMPPRAPIGAFSKLAETMVIRCLGRLRSTASRGSTPQRQGINQELQTAGRTSAMATDSSGGLRASSKPRSEPSGTERSSSGRKTGATKVSDSPRASVCSTAGSPERSRSGHWAGPVSDQAPHLPPTSRSRAASGSAAESPQRACERGVVAEGPAPRSGETPKSLRLSGAISNRKVTNMQICFLLDIRILDSSDSGF